MPERDGLLYEGCPSRPIHLTQRERQIVALLLQAYDNQEIADALGMKLRTVKAHFGRLFLRFGITDGMKRIKLAVLLYRAQLKRETLTEGDHA